MPVPADLQQNIFVTVYLTILHNFVAIFYFIGLIATTVYTFIKPSRPLILIMAGFALLLFAFEYNKHLAAEFKIQTMNSLITTEGHHKTQRLLEIFFNKVIPVGLPIAGWLLLISGCIMGFSSKKNKSN